MAANKTKPRGAIPEKTMRDALMVELASTLPTKVKDERGREKVEQFRKARLVAMAMVNAAIKGDVGAGKLIFDRADGKLVNVIAGDPNAPLVQQVTHQAAPAEPKANYDDLTLDQLVREHTARTIAAANNETKH